MEGKSGMYVVTRLCSIRSDLFCIFLSKEGCRNCDLKVVCVSPGIQLHMLTVKKIVPQIALQLLLFTRTLLGLRQKYGDRVNVITTCLNIDNYRKESVFIRLYIVTPLIYLRQWPQCFISAEKLEFYHFSRSHVK